MSQSPKRIRQGEGRIRMGAQNRKAIAMIRKYINMSLFEHVLIYTNAYELCTKLESLFQNKTLRKKYTLLEDW